MAVVLSSEENPYFSSGGLRRTHSQPKFLSTTSGYAKSPCRSMSINSFPRLITRAASIPLCEESSTKVIHSCSSFRMASPDESPSARYSKNNEDDSITFPSYGQAAYYTHSEEEASSISPPIEDSYTISPTLSPTSNTSTNISIPQSLDLGRHAEDDTAVRIQPSRHVDYLSHNWREEDIWSSWKYVVSKRKTYNNSARLENASWRSWIKAKYKLKTVSPEALNWLKDCDVTWLYGPLQTLTESTYHAPSTSPTTTGDSTVNRLPESSSFSHKKPILKKRSMSELMLQQCLSTSSLLKQAAGAVQALQSRNLAVCTQTPCTTFTTSMNGLATRRASDLPSFSISSVSSSNLTSPVNGDRKRIHFNEQVAQCIAVDVKGDDDDEVPFNDYGESDSEDCGIMMKPSTTKRKYPVLQRRKKVCPNPNQENNKIIAMLPSTTLKNLPDIADSLEVAGDQYDDELWDEGEFLSPSISLETLRPSKPSIKMFIGTEEEEEDDDNIDWQPPISFPNRKDNFAVVQERKKTLISSDSCLNLRELDETDIDGDERVGLKRTESGMFMPDKADDNYNASEGLFGKVVETVNTAKDIAHVIWNVGWRR